MKTKVVKKKESARLPEADQRLAVQRQTAIAVEHQTLTEIIGKITAYRVDMERLANGFVASGNNARAIGQLILGWWETLPGKQMTIDFWQRWQDRMVDRHGRQIELDELKWFVRIALNNPEPFTTVQQVLAARQMVFLAAGFALEGEHTPGRPHDPPNAYSQLTSLFDPKPLEATLRALEKDPNYGSIEKWPPERKQRVWLQIEPFVNRVLALREKFTTPVVDV